MKELEALKLELDNDMLYMEYDPGGNDVIIWASEYGYSHAEVFLNEENLELAINWLRAAQKKMKDSASGRCDERT